MRLKSNTKLLPSINSKEFKRLHYKEQLYILNLFMHDEDKYREFTATTGPMPGLEYIDDAMKKLISTPNRGQPDTSDHVLPFHFVQNQWACYSCYYDDGWYRGGISPLDVLGIDHIRMFSLHLFTFPFISCDARIRPIVRWLSKEKTLLADFFFWMVKLRAAAEYLSESEEEEVADHWNSAIVGMPDIGTVDDLNGEYPIIDPADDLIFEIEDETFALCFNRPIAVEDRVLYPLIPAQLYNQELFHIKGWSWA